MYRDSKNDCSIVLKKSVMGPRNVRNPTPCVINIHYHTEEHNASVSALPMKINTLNAVLTLIRCNYVPDNVWNSLFQKHNI